MPESDARIDRKARELNYRLIARWIVDMCCWCIGPPLRLCLNAAGCLAVSYCLYRIKSAAVTSDDEDSQKKHNRSDE
jgi:hypothetical protein